MVITQLRKLFLMVVAGFIIISCDDPEPSFSFQIVVLAYDNSSKDFEPTSAHLGVASNGVAVITKELAAEITTVSMPEKEGNLKVYVSKDGYILYEQNFTSAELKQFGGSPLEVKLLDKSIMEGMVAFYPFNGNTSDSSGHYYHGLPNGPTLTTDRKGKENSSYFFDGINDYVGIAHNKALDFEQDFTISLWALVSSTQLPHEGINDIIQKWNGNSDGYPYSISYLNPMADDAIEDKITYARHDGSACGHTPTSYSPLIANDEFIHIILIKQGTKLRHYLNGNLIQEFTDDTFCFTSNTANITIGCRGNLTKFFTGKIDDVRFYNRAITEGEVAMLFVE